MKEIPKQVIEKVVRNYMPECRFLKSASLEYPIVRGEFIVGKTFYHVPSCEHATDVEIQLCLNQLIYAGVSTAITENNIPELDNLDFEKLRRESMLIIESRKRFRRAIKTQEQFYGVVKLDCWKDFGKILIAQASFNFGDRSCIGGLELALVKPASGETKT